MVALSFAKYSGCGNDFIILDNRFRPLMLTPHQVQHLCHRKEGIGADGVLLLEDSTQADYKMRIYNSDGSEAEMCGNGIRCLGDFIAHLEGERRPLKIETFVGFKTLRPNTQSFEVELVQDPIEPSIAKLEQGWFFYLDTGVPHAVHFLEDIENVDLETWAPPIRRHPAFGERGANVNIAKRTGPQHISLRTFERGVEAETAACGTGAAAAAIAAAEHFGLLSPIHVLTKLGETLLVGFHKNGSSYQSISQTGPVRQVFTGIAAMKESYGT